MRRLVPLLALCCLAAPSAQAEGPGPVYKDAERFAAPQPYGAQPLLPPGAWGAPVPFGRPVNGGPGYVGSDWGLGRPAYTGLGSRPDWGRSSD